MSTQEECCKHALGVCDDGAEVGGAGDRAAGGAGGGNSTGVVQAAASCKHALGYMLIFSKYHASVFASSLLFPVVQVNGT